MLEGSIYEQNKLVAELKSQPRLCSWRGITGDEEPCGEPATHFGHEFTGDAPGSYRYVWRCLKHETHEGAFDEFHEILDEVSSWDYVAKEGERLETKEQVLELVRRQKDWLDAYSVAWLDYAEGVAKLSGPGTVPEVNEVYEATINKVRREYR